MQEGGRPLRMAWNHDQHRPNGRPWRHGALTRRYPYGDSHEIVCRVRSAPEKKVAHGIVD